MTTDAWLDTAAAAREGNDARACMPELSSSDTSCTAASPADVAACEGRRWADPLLAAWTAALQLEAERRRADERSRRERKADCASGLYRRRLREGTGRWEVEGPEEGEEEGEDGWEDMRMPRTSSCEQRNNKVQEEDETIYIGTRQSLSICSN